MKLLFQFFGIVLFTSVLFSCRKKSDPVPEKKIYLVQETRSTGSTTNYRYDNQSRFAGHVYRDASNHQETVVTQYASNNLPSELQFRDITNSRASKYNYTYDAQNRPTRVEIRDSVNPSTYTLRITYEFTYTAAKITRFTTNVPTGATTRIEITLNANGNFVKEETYKADGTKSFEYTYTGYDDKKNPRNATFVHLYNFPNTTNNNTAYNGGLVGGTVNNYTATYSYNADGYPTQTVWSSGLTYAYTYEKR